MSDTGQNLIPKPQVVESASATTDATTNTSSSAPWLIFVAGALALFLVVSASLNFIGIVATRFADTYSSVYHYNHDFDEDWDFDSEFNNDEFLG